MHICFFKYFFPFCSDFLRKGIKEQFAKLLVLPNKFVLPLVDLTDLQTSSLKFTQPVGVVRLEVIEARHLKKSDVGMLGLLEDTFFYPGEEFF